MGDRIRAGAGKGGGYPSLSRTGGDPSTAQKNEEGGPYPPLFRKTGTHPRALRQGPTPLSRRGRSCASHGTPTGMYISDHPAKRGRGSAAFPSKGGWVPLPQQDRGGPLHRSNK